MIKLQKRWLAALRSGKYKQGRLRLRSGDNFCCLGVLCDVYDPKEWGEYGTYDYAHNMPPLDVLIKCCLTPSFAHALAEANDKGKSFSEIADMIEERFT